jgi:uncharacterized YccA/Bax inhibitor family protein
VIPDQTEATVRSSNPVLTRLTPVAPTAYQSRAGYAPDTTYPPASVTTAYADRMTVDDVVVRTVGLLALTGASGAVAWTLVPDRLLFAAWMGAAIVGLIIGLVISFARVTNPLAIGSYAVVEGIFVGLVSKFFNAAYPGIVVQAAAGTFGVFFLMSMLYKFRVIRATPRFTRGVIAAMFGVFAIIMVNWMLSLFGVYTGLRGGADGRGGWLAIGFSLVVIVIASLTFILDFDLIEQSVRQGAPRKMAWTCAFGLLVGLIWVYLEVLRLLSYLRGRD